MSPISQWDPRRRRPQVGQQAGYGQGLEYPTQPPAGQPRQWRQPNFGAPMQQQSPQPQGPGAANPSQQRPMGSPPTSNVGGRQQGSQVFRQTFGAPMPVRAPEPASVFHDVPEGGGRSASRSLSLEDLLSRMQEQPGGGSSDSNYLPDFGGILRAQQQQGLQGKDSSQAPGYTPAGRDMANTGQQAYGLTADGQRVMGGTGTPQGPGAWSQPVNIQAQFLSPDQEGAGFGYGEWVQDASTGNQPMWRRDPENAAPITITRDGRQMTGRWRSGAFVEQGLPVAPPDYMGDPRDYNPPAAAQQPPDFGRPQFDWQGPGANVLPGVGSMPQFDWTQPQQRELPGVQQGPQFNAPNFQGPALPQSLVEGAPGATAPAPGAPNAQLLPLGSTARNQYIQPPEFQQQQINLPNPNDLLKERLRDFDVLNREETQRKLEDLNTSLAQRGLFSSGSAEELQKRVLDESNRARNQFITEQMVESERQTQANARDEASLRLQAQQQYGQLGIEAYRAVGEGTSREYRDQLDTFLAGEQQSGRLSKENLDRWLAARGATQQDREYALNRYDAELRGQGQAFSQAVNTATTRSQLLTEEQNRNIAQYRTEMDTAGQNFQQALAAHQQGQLDQAQLQDVTLKYWQAKNQYEQQDFTNRLALYEADGRLSHQDVQDWTALYDIGLRQRRSEQDVMTRLIELENADDASKRQGLIALFGTAAQTVDNALDRVLRAAALTQEGQTTNAEINAANAAARASQAGGVLAGAGNLLQNFLG